MTSYPSPPTGQNPPPSAGPPAPQPYGAPPPQPYGAPAPPPAVPVVSAAVKAPPVAWLVPVAALLAVLGVFTPWFKAKATTTVRGQTFHDTADALYSWKDGKIGLLAPILLVVLAVGVVGLLLGRSPARFNRGDAHPVATAGKFSLIAGVISLGCVVIAWFLVKSQYRFPGPNGTDVSWNQIIKLAKNSGIELALSRGPQIGYYLTAAAALLAIVAGILMIVASRGKAVPTPYGYLSAPKQ